MEIKNLKAGPEHKGMRCDVFIAQQSGLSRSAVQRLMELGQARLNGAVVGKKEFIQPGDQAELRLPDPKPAQAQPQQIPLDIVYEDQDVVVVNKPKGMVVHPAPGNYTGTLVNALVHYCGESLSGINGVLRPGIVHRIDKDTSGLLLVAKNDMAHRGLAGQIQAHSLKREYRAVVYGGFREDKGTVDAPLGRSPADRKKIAVLHNAPGARKAVTHFFVEERLPGFTYLRLRLETGRTHQIRVHMAYAGDPVYGPKKVITELQGQCLHAGLLGFVHPRTGEYVELSAELPEYFSRFLHKLHSKEYEL